MKCKLCSREAGEKDYCDFHMRAYQNVVEKYDVWNRACGFSWKEYLSEIAKNPLTGEWAKEMVEYLAKNGEKQDVKGS